MRMNNFGSRVARNVAKRSYQYAVRSTYDLLPQTDKKKRKKKS